MITARGHLLTSFWIPNKSNFFFPQLQIEDWGWGYCLAAGDLAKTGLGPALRSGWPKARPRAERSGARRAEQTCEPRSIAAADLGEA
ncbi:hypothetical protein SGRA_1730 [Saprospira grandis str. Lewin]|uniref:Uncharacterized protein n=1 Tax=Saprospira grandis (strain Lewin) TaxID=984262 RepID=H6KZ75_SAPGL|nr:hypothetical protein SGRA_1730 [Saprospira grandis str. Lewin]